MAKAPPGRPGVRAIGQATARLAAGRPMASAKLTVTARLGPARNISQSPAINRTLKIVPAVSVLILIQGPEVRQAKYAI